MDRKKIIYIICGIIAIGAAAILMLGGSAKEEGSGPLKPEEVTEAFCRAVAAGDFTAACSLCDTVGMAGYMDGCRKIWEDVGRQDSTVAAIAKEMMKAMEFRTDDVSKDGNIRIVDYTISLQEGQSKSGKAYLRKEEGAWIVERITDRQ